MKSLRFMMLTMHASEEWLWLVSIDQLITRGRSNLGTSSKSDGNLYTSVLVWCIGDSYIAT